MKLLRMLTGVAGLLGVMLAIPVFVAGTGLMWWTADGVAELPTVAVRTDGRAYVATDIEGVWRSLDLPVPSVRQAFLTVDGDSPLFVGIGPAHDVDEFLASGATPGSQTFWVHSSDGASVDWDVEPGRWTAVVMNPDGSPGVQADLRGTLPTGPLRLAGGILLTVGLAIGGIGTLVMAAAWGGRPARGRASVPAPA